MDTITEILAERGKEYGPFDRHATITQQIKRVVYGYADLDRLTDDHREALDMIAHKIGRIVNGNPNNVDSWSDIAGYATLVADRLRKKQNPNG